MRDPVSTIVATLGPEPFRPVSVSVTVTVVRTLHSADRFAHRESQRRHVHYSLMPPHLVTAFAIGCGSQGGAMKHDVEYERFLATLVGDAFEDEVCDRLRALFTDFQRIPRRGGDAGLDGHSHRQTRAYCCYGPHLEPAKLAKKGALKDDIVAKFRGDLCKLFEIEHQGKAKIVQVDGQMSTIIGDGLRLTSIVLVVNWFEDKRLIGLLNTSFRNYVKASACNFVSPDCGLSIWGPKDLAGLALVDDATRFRAENRVLVSKLREVEKSTPMPLPTATLKDFDSKFDWVVAQQPANANQVNDLRERFREAWSKALVLETQLEASAVRLHEALESSREHAATTAQLRSLEGLLPGRLLSDARNDIRQHLTTGFGDGGIVSATLVDGEVARLVGECPIEWRK